MTATKLSFCHECGSPVGHSYNCPLAVLDSPGDPGGATPTAGTVEREVSVSAARRSAKVTGAAAPAPISMATAASSVEDEYRRLIESAERLLASHVNEVTAGRAAAAAEAKAASAGLLVENAALKAALAASEQSLYDLRLSLAALTGVTPTLGE